MNSLISPHFTLDEVTFSSIASRSGIDNTVDDTNKALVAAIYNTATKLELVRAVLNEPIHIDSWYRCPQLNEAVGSKPTSQHIKGEAVDFICPEFGTPLDICRCIISHLALIQFDQLILEHTWVHISWSSIPGVKQRQQVLSLLSNGSYAEGLTDNTGKPYTY